jgi:hypothetical protein
LPARTSNGEAGGEQTFDGPVCSAALPGVESWRYSVYSEFWKRVLRVARSIQLTVISSIGAQPPTL